MSDVIAIEPKTVWEFRSGVPGTVKVMAVVDGWVVARRKGASPFLTHCNDWHGRFSPLPRPTPEAS